MPYNFLFIGLIKSIFPKAKFVHVSRNPIGNCFSVYKNYFSNNSHFYTNQLENIIDYYNFYKKTTSYWEDIYINDIYNLRYEKLIINREDEIKKLISFCNLKWNLDYLKPHKNKRLVFTASAPQVRKKIYSNSVNNWKNYSKFLYPYMRRIN